MIKTTVPIRGMHCKSCEILIGGTIEDLPHVKKVEMSYKKKVAEIYSDSPLDMQKVEEAIRDVGYSIGEDKKRSWMSRKSKDYSDLGLALLLFGFLFFIGSGLGLFTMNIGSSNPSNLAVVLLIGLTAGVSTCMALIGGLVLGISARHNARHPEANAMQKFRPHIFFNLGRILSYFILGGLVGFIGTVFQFSSPVLGVMTIFVGLVMLILGIKLLDIFPKMTDATLSLPSSISSFLGTKKGHTKEYSHFHSMLLGGATFFLPCGFTQAMQLYAMSTGSFLSGGLIMAVFALGTMPGLLTIGGFTSVIKGNVANIFFKFAGIVVIFLAFFNISNGYNLAGFSLDLVPDTSIYEGQITNVTMENGVQVARMTESYAGFSPTTFIVRKDIPVKWIVNAEALNSCAAGISAPSLDIRKNLVLGENIFEFTPTQTGKIKFTCLMGMYPGEFIVTD